MNSARRRLALVAFLLLTLGGSATVAVGTSHVNSGGHLPPNARVLGPDALANGLVVGAAPKGAARGTATSSSKRNSRAILLAALGGTLGALALLRRRHPGPVADVATQVRHQLALPSRAPPGLAPTHS